MANDSERDLVENLKSQNTSEVNDALMKIRKYYVRNHQKLKKLLTYSVIESIIPHLEHPKFCITSLSIITEGCMELNFMNDFIKHKGIQSLMRIMKSSVNDDVQSRACRALGNIAKFHAGFKAVHLAKPVSNIVHFLSETNDAICQKTAVRTLMILGNNAKTRELIARENGVICIAKLLSSSNVDVLISSTKALANLTQNCSSFCARQLLEEKFFEVFIQLQSHSEKLVQNNVLILLKNLSCHEEIRSDLVKAGAVKLCTEVLSHESHEMSGLAALALCNYLDHIHMWSHNGTDKVVGLQALLLVLQNQKYQDIHLRIITSLIPLSYESKVSDILLNLDLLPVLTQILKDFIKKNKCKSLAKSPLKSDCNPDFDFVTSDRKRVKECESAIFSSEVNFTSQLPVIPKEMLQTDSNRADDIKDDERLNVNRNVKSSASPDAHSSKIPIKWDRSIYSFSSITSDYSSSCSPNRICSPVQKFSASPEVFYEYDVGSPLGQTSLEAWSISYPVSAMDNAPQHITCWSPVVSSHSNSPTPENEFDKCDTEGVSIEQHSIKQFNISSNDDNALSSISSFTDSHSFLSDNSKSTDKCEKLTVKSESNCAQNLNSPDPETPKKKLKVEKLNDKSSEVGDQIPADSASVNKDGNLELSKHVSDNTKSDVKQLSEGTEKQTIDHYTVLFILQLSFHIERKPNSQIADKNCFSVLMDYLCFIHHPSHKAETILTNLIKNRYCFEKLILNGFISELEDKLASSNYPCIHRSDVKLIYSNLIKAGRQEAESDYGIGTLSHILTTSERSGQLYAICALAKLVTEKSALYRLLFQANGLSLLLGFLSNSCDVIRKKAVISVCEVYQSLTKERKSEKCCFLGTCSLRTSSYCSYRNSSFDVTFSLDTGVKILANREKVCENSEYFRALLGGYFVESTAEVVTLSNITAENLSTIFHFLHGCGSAYCCPYITRIPVSVLLELLSDCDRFLLIDMKAFVEDRLCHLLSPGTVPKIYQQSKIHNSPALTKRSLNFALNLDLLEKDILLNCFEQLLHLETNLNFLGDIQTLLNDIF